MPIHPTAIIDRHVEIDPTADVGAYAVVEAGVKIGPRCKIWHHAFIAQGTTLGEDVQIHPFAVVGHEPQDLGWKRTPSYTRIGDGTIIREHATIHRGTPAESTTILGRRCFVMSTGHVGHNCTLGDDVKIANGAHLSGWCHVGDGTFLSGGAQVQQFTRVGELCMVGGTVRVPNDVAPFTTVGTLGLVGLNVVGLRRAGFTAEQRNALRAAYKTIFRGGLLFQDALARVEAIGQDGPVRRFVEFLRGPSKRGFLRYRGGGRSAGAAEYDVV